MRMRIIVIPVRTILNFALLGWLAFLCIVYNRGVICGYLMKFIQLTSWVIKQLTSFYTDEQNSFTLRTARYSLQEIPYVPFRTLSAFLDSKSQAKK
ncbi:hypothetical protein BDQ17DRAFT_1353202 [Cyathus striatus]|nr:hypothetical protein BDQ17DRAFT_1353202 [Cyathus striatus]